MSLRIEKKKIRPRHVGVPLVSTQPAARHGGAQGRCRGLCALRRGTPRRGQPRTRQRGCRSAGAAARARGPLRRARGGVVQRVWCRRACRRVRQAAGCRSAAACCRDRPAGEMQARGAWAIPPDCKHRPPSNSWLPRGGVAPSAAAGREGGEARCAEEVVARSSASAGQCRNGREGMRCLCNQRPHARAPRSSQPPDPGCLRPHSHGPVGPGNEKP